MKKLLAVSLALVLAGCAEYPRAPAQTYAQPRDPSQWRVVSVTPVPAGTAARVAAGTSDGKAVEYSSTPVAPMPPAYAAAPLYAPPRYAPAPVYQAEPAYYWPPVTLSLGFVFGRHWSSGHHRGWRRR
jgi:hypothetical protein